MFTGIVQARGQVAALDRNAFGARLAIDLAGWRPAGAPIAPGDSICVSGVCLTVAGIAGDRLEFDVIAETLARTTLGDLRRGARVNLEPSLTASTPLGGHLVQGHVDGVGPVASVRSTAEEWRLTVTPPSDLMDYIVPKGSVAIDGVSLTIAAVTESQVQVALIPTTLRLTTLSELRQGDRVNLECDVVARTVVHWLRRQAGKGSGLSLDALHRAGFVS